MKYLVHFDDDGRITATVNDPVPPGYVEMCDERGMAYLLVDGHTAPVTIYADMMVVDGALADRPACPVSVSVDGRAVTLADVPVGTECTVEIEGAVIPLHDDGFEIDEPGPVILRIRPPWPYREAVHDLEIE